MYNRKNKTWIKILGVTDTRRIFLKRENKTIETNTFIAIFNTPQCPPPNKNGVLNWMSWIVSPNPYRMIESPAIGMPLRQM